MRGATRLLPAAALALLLAVVLAACGGDDSEDSTAGPASTPSERTAPAGPSEDEDRGTESDRGSDTAKAKEPRKDQARAAGGSDGSGSGASGGSGSSGSGSRGSGGSGDPGNSGSRKGSSDSRGEGSDSSIQGFGDDANTAERRAASAVVLAFMQARAAGDWETVCSHMSSTTLKPVEQLAGRLPQYKGKGCAEILVTLTSQSPEAFRASAIDGALDSLRVEDERAFAVYRGTDGDEYFLPLIKEGGEWKVGAIAPSATPD